MEDITLRALNVLKSVDWVLCEDTRVSGKLLKHYQIQKPLKAYHAYNEHKVLPGVIAKLKAGDTAALLSDAGTPGISDPGFLIVRACMRENIFVQALPGASAFIPALIQSGFPCDRFVFEGFLPHKKGRKTRLEYIQGENRTVILYESPHRILKTLEQLGDYLDDDRQISVSRELTKVYEETVTGSAAEVLRDFAGRKDIKGEFVIVIKGKDKS